MPLAIAHRGDWRSAPENTVAAFEAAERAGADLIELDVRLTRDGEVAVVHDATFERVWGSPTAVARATLDEVRSLRAGTHAVCTLEEALRSVSIGVMVDFDPTDVAEPALEVIEEAGALDRVVFSGENVEAYRRIRARAPDARIALTWMDHSRPPDALLDELGVEFLNPPWDLVDGDLVRDMRARGTKVSTWTVDDPAEMRRMIDAGVDAVITNRIELLVPLLAEAAC